jgi:sporulation integral membrane protein YlbJ
MNFVVISFKKYFFTIIFIIFTICLLLFSSNNLVAAQDGLALWAKSVLPTLFPFFVATELLCQTNFTYLLGKLLNKFMRPFFNVPGESAAAVILGTISGYPVGAKVVVNLKNKKIISKIEAERLIAFTNNSGPLFILGTVGIALLKNKKIGWILLISHILASLTVGYFFRFWKRDKLEINFQETKFNTKLAPIKVSDIGEILGNAIKKSIMSVLSIGGFIVLFSVILSILETSGIFNLITSFFYNFGIPKDITKSVVTGIIELTNGVSLASTLYELLPTFTILLISFLLGFGGISVLFQVYSIISKENISIKPYFYGKLLQGIFSVIFTFLLI